MRRAKEGARSTERQRIETGENDMIAAELEDYLNGSTSEREAKKREWINRLNQCMFYFWFEEAKEYKALLRAVEDRELEELAALEAFCRFMIRKSEENPDKIWL